VAKLSQDICAEKASGAFPKHGWAFTADRSRTAMLWLPIYRPLVDQGCYVVEFRKEDNGRSVKDHVVNEELLPYTNGAKAAHLMLIRLVVAFSRLAALVREVRGVNASTMSSEESHQIMDEASELMPIYADYALVLHRRFADQLFRALAPNLYEHPHCAPELRKFLREYPSPKAGPKFEKDDYVKLKLSATDWIKQLRGAESGGLRDLLTHRSSAVSASFSFTADAGRVFLMLTPKAAEPPRTPVIDLVDELKKINAGMCDFLTTVCRVLGIVGEYRGNRDWSPVTGNTSDINEFWPAL
jgi:hypothetical protein